MPESFRRPMRGPLHRLRVAATAPDEPHSRVIYPAAAVKSSKEPAEAKRFLDFLVGAKSRRVFEKYGFKSMNR
jgi:molybdate transport system substrate-binding protein